MPIEMVRFHIGAPPIEDLLNPRLPNLRAAVRRGKATHFLFKPGTFHNLMSDGVDHGKTLYIARLYVHENDITGEARLFERTPEGEDLREIRPIIPGGPALVIPSPDQGEGVKVHAVVFNSDLHAHN